jgi:hypothetical protein
MTALTRREIAAATLLGLIVGDGSLAEAQQSQVQPPSPLSDQDFLLTVFLRHDESKTLGEINAHLKQSGFFKRFPPPGSEVVSWYVMMGIGQVVTLKVSTGQLRDVNRVLEETAWGGFRTEFYPTYDYRQRAAEIRKEMQ